MVVLDLGARSRGWVLQLRRGADWAVVGLAALAGLFTFGSLVGLWPWLTLPLTMGETPLPHAGIVLQLALTALPLLLCLTLPANRRMAALEHSHRNFAVGMEDLARAYRLAHAADRAGVFSLSGEFDSIRERMEHLRRHPDLQSLEPELLQLASQMSHQARELAHVYSDARVERARIFLRQRQEEVADLADRITMARTACDDLRRWLTEVQADEKQAQAQVKRIEADLRDLLPQIGFMFESDDSAPVWGKPH